MMETSTDRSNPTHAEYVITFIIAFFFSVRLCSFFVFHFISFYSFHFSDFGGTNDGKEKPFTIKPVGSM